MEDNKRRFARIPVKVQVFLRDVDTAAVIYFYSRNLSTGGIFLETGLYLDEETKVNIEFTVPGHPKFISVEAEVAWTVPEDWDPRIHPPGMGLKFLKISEENKKIIESYIAMKANKIF